MERTILTDVHKYSKLPNVPQTLHFHKNTNMTTSHPLNVPLLLANESRNIRNILVKDAGQFRLRPCLIFVFSSEVLPWATEHTWTAILCLEISDPHSAMKWHPTTRPHLHINKCHLIVGWSFPETNKWCLLFRVKLTAHIPARVHRVRLGPVIFY